MHFTKMHGAGNDYVYVDLFREEVPDPAAASIAVSDRHFGIGSDGLILIGPSDCADFRMHMYNADGSRAKMCGNGVRCVAKFVFDHGLTDKTEITVETDSGIKTLRLFPENGKVKTVRVNMGAPEFTPEKIPFVPPAGEGLEVGGKTYRATAVSMGNPHCVVFLDEDPREFPVTEIGPVFEHLACFPDRVNTEFILVEDPHNLRMRVWERGSGETLACGTGACASACAAIAKGLAESPVAMHLTGGDLTVEWDGSGDVFMTGPAVEVFQGEFEL